MMGDGRVGAVMERGEQGQREEEQGGQRTGEERKSERCLRNEGRERKEEWA